MGDNINALRSRLNVLSTLISRANLMSRLGQQYDDSRKIYAALGYKIQLTYEDFASYYERNEMAKAIINRPVETTWRGEFGILESDDEDVTPLETAWEELNDRISLKQAFVRLDKLSSLGNYGVLFLGLDDAKNSQMFSKPVDVGGGRKLLYIKPYGQGNAKISSYDTNTGSPRYGLPLTYSLNIIDASGTTSSAVQAHYDRIIHVPGETLESEYLGVPTLQVVFNRLMDLEKLVGGSAEMFWRGARPGYQGKVDPEFIMTPETEAGLKDQIDEYEHNLRRIITSSGVDLQSLAMQVADPKSHVDIQIQMISAVTGIPKRILTGSELGELASSEDKTNWLSLIASRRSEYAELQIVHPFVDRMIEHGVFPPAKENYSVQWEDLFAQSDKEQAEVGRTRSESLRNYAMSPTAESIVPPDAFYEFFLGFDADQIEMITQLKEEMIEEEQNRVLTPEEQAIIDAEAKAKANLNNPLPADDHGTDPKVGKANEPKGGNK